MVAMQCYKRALSNQWQVLDIIWLLAYLVACISSDVMTDKHKGPLQEYCNLETFRPRCMKNEVIVIEEAYYGRRRVGKCIDVQEAADFAHDSRFLGCYADVIGSLNTRCSGKKQCEIRIADPELETTRTCLKGLHMFLEVSYTCVPVVEDDRSCVVPVTSSPLYIASTPSVGHQSNTGHIHCGLKAQPYLLEAPAGQRINVSLLDFSSNVTVVAESRTGDLTRASRLSGSSRSPGGSLVGTCTHQDKPQYGYVVDKSTGGGASRKNVSICGGRQSGVLTNVYLSTSNAIELVLITGEPETPQGIRSNFLIKVEAVGCTNLVPPEDAWIKRDNENIVIGCYTTRQTWQLRCDDGRWIGVLSNCTQNADLTAPVHAKEMFLPANSYQIATVVAIGFTGLAICLTIICCGVVCLKRYYAEKIALKTNSSKYNDLVVTSEVDRFVSPVVLSNGKSASPNNALLG